MANILSLISRGVTRITMRDALHTWEAPATIPILLPFTVADSVLDIDLGQFIDERKISAVKTIFIDNRANNTSLIVVNVETQQTIEYPPYSQGYMNVLTAQRPKLQFICTAGAINIPAQLINIEMQPNIWTVLGGTTVSITGIVDTEEQATLAVDYSDDIAIGGVAQQAIPANATRLEAWIDNSDSSLTSEPIWINITGTAAINGVGSFPIYYGTGWSGKITNAISIIAATTGHKYMAGER